MSLPYRISHRIAAAVAAGCAGLALAGTASAVDLRDWGRKFPASERFVVLASFNNQAVLDKETQLVWQAVPTPATYTWANAHVVCYNATIGGRRGWRLPTFPEAASVLGTDGAKPPAFNGVPNDVYWTATDFPSVDGYAFSILVPNGASVVNLNNIQHPLWCVRGPA